MPYAPPDKNFRMNEYQGITDRIEDLETQVFTRGVYSAEEQKEYNELIKSRNSYKDYIYSMKELDEDVLKNKYKYNHDQINAIKNYDGSEEMALRASAYIVAALSVKSFWYSSSDNKTYTYVTFSGHWEGTPFEKQQDSIAIAVVGDSGNFQQTSYWNEIIHSNGTVFRNTNSYYYPMLGVAYKFGITQTSLDIFRQFSMGYNAMATGRVALMDCAATYVHHRTMFNGIGISIGKSGASASFSFERGSTQMWYDTRSSRL